ILLRRSHMLPAISYRGQQGKGPAGGYRGCPTLRSSWRWLQTERIAPELSRDARLTHRRQQWEPPTRDQETNGELVRTARYRRRCRLAQRARGRAKPRRGSNREKWLVRRGHVARLRRSHRSKKRVLQVASDTKRPFRAADSVWPSREKLPSAYVAR